VSGKVTVDQDPLKSRGGVVNLVPNKDKGNTTTLEPTGVVDEDGNYTVYYAKKKKGAPPGWYKVQVTAMPPGDQPPPMPRPWAKARRRLRCSTPNTPALPHPVWRLRSSGTPHRGPTI
jgi:hypothetical protein